MAQLELECLDAHNEEEHMALVSLVDWRTSLLDRATLECNQRNPGLEQRFQPEIEPQGTFGKDLVMARNAPTHKALSEIWQMTPGRHVRF